MLEKDWIQPKFDISTKKMVKSANLSCAFYVEHNTE